MPMAAKATPPTPVLVTEDDPSIRALLITAFRRRRIQVTTATNGQEAIDLLQRQEWCVLVLDLMMPEVSGWDVIDWMAAHRERKPNSVVVVSAADRTLIQQLDPTVVNALIFKPFDVFVLTSYVKAACRLSHRDRRHSRRIGDVSLS